MIDAPLALAFTAGVVATLNPCGFAMLPAYLSWYVGTDDTPAGPGTALAERVGRALLVGGTVSFGFLVIFGITGALVTAGVRSFVDYVPWAALVIGAALIALGVALLAGRRLNVVLPTLEPGRRQRRFRSMLVFGASYAVASLSCTLPVFLSVVASTFTRSNWASGVATFAAYALGMSAVLLTLTIALAVAQHSLVRRLRTLSGQVNRAAGVLLVLAGGYIVYYWVFNLSTDPDQTTGAGPARFVERLSADAAEWVRDRGWATVLVATGAVIAAAAVAVVARHHDTTATVSDETGVDLERSPVAARPGGAR